MVTATFSLAPAQSKPKPPACIAPKAKGKSLTDARRMIKRAHCRTGTIRRSFSNVKKNHVISQTPGHGRISSTAPGSTCASARASDRDVVVQGLGVRSTCRGPAARRRVGCSDNWRARPQLWHVGTVTTSLVGPVGDSPANALLLQPDGKLIAVGDSDANPTDGQDPLPQISLVRYNPDGSWIRLRQLRRREDHDPGRKRHANAALLQPDGKIVVAGYYWPKGRRVFALLRYDADGSLDPSFGTGGIVTTPVGDDDSEAFGVVLQPDGKIVAGGLTNDSNGSNSRSALVRYNPDGTLDASFGSDGIVLDTHVRQHGFAAIALQPDGKILGVKTLAPLALDCHPAHPLQLRRHARLELRQRGRVQGCYRSGRRADAATGRQDRRRRRELQLLLGHSRRSRRNRRPELRQRRHRHDADGPGLQRGIRGRAPAGRQGRGGRPEPGRPHDRPLRPGRLARSDLRPGRHRHDAATPRPVRAGPTQAPPPWFCNRTERSTPQGGPQSTAGLAINSRLPATWAAAAGCSRCKSSAPVPAASAPTRSGSIAAQPALTSLRPSRSP